MFYHEALQRAQEETAARTDGLVATVYQRSTGQYGWAFSMIPLFATVVAYVRDGYKLSPKDWATAQADTARGGTE